MVHFFTDGSFAFATGKTVDSAKPIYGGPAITIACEDCHCEITIKFDTRAVGTFELLNCPLCGKQLAWFTPTQVIQYPPEE
jgi:hypothetical protein